MPSVNILQLRDKHPHAIRDRNRIRVELLGGRIDVAMENRTEPLPGTLVPRRFRGNPTFEFASIKIPVRQNGLDRLADLVPVSAHLEAELHLLLVENADLPSVIVAKNIFIAPAIHPEIASELLRDLAEGLPCLVLIPISHPRSAHRDAPFMLGDDSSLSKSQPVETTTYPYANLAIEESQPCRF